MSVGKVMSAGATLISTINVPAFGNSSVGVFEQVGWDVVVSSFWG